MNPTILELIYHYLYLENFSKKQNCDKPSDKAFAVYKILLEKLNKEQTDLFEKFIELNCDEQSEESCAHFKAGLKLGLSIGIECFYDSPTD